MKPKLPTYDQIEKYYKKIDQNRLYSNRGPMLRLYEENLSKFLNVPKDNIVLIANATLALEGLIRISEPTEWVLPSFTFAATGLAVINSGVSYELLDVDPVTWNLNLSKKSNSHVNRGIVQVIPFGDKVKVDTTNLLSPVIIDAAASLGNQEINLDQIKSSDAIVFSLQATKVLGCGEGGLVVCGSIALANKLRSWLNFGFCDSRNSETIGTNAKLSEYSCAVGLASLDFWVEEKSEWDQRHNLNQQISSTLKITPPYINSNHVTPYWIVYFESEEHRHKVVNALNSHGIESRLWWSGGLHKMRVFHSTNNFENTELISKRYLGLPNSRDLSFETINKIGQVIKEVIN
jgi:dTDP-4-amino-4,6-dideoxygalactose transaminase